MAVTKDRKAEVLMQLAKLFQDAKSVAVTKFTGTAVNDMNSVRSEMFTKGVKLVVAKKTLIKLAAAKADYKEIPAEVLDGPVALAFGMEDEILAPKIIKDTSKKFDTFGLVGGFMDGKVLSKAEITQLADIPPYEVLIAQFLRAIKAPVSGFHGVLHGTLRNFVGVLNAIKEKVETESPAAEAPVEAPAPAPEATETATETPAEAETPAAEAESTEEAAADATDEPTSE